MSAISGVTHLGSNRRTESISEHSLVEKCKRQDLAAFGKLVDAYQARVFGFVRRLMPCHEDAADLTQEVFIRAYQGFARFDGRCSLRTWLFRIAYNLCIDRVRKNARSVTDSRLDLSSEEESIEVSDSRWDPQSTILDDELYGVVSEAIDSMSEKLKTVLLLHDRDDLSYDEIAQVMGIPVGTVKSRLFLARAHLQNQVSRYWAEGDGI